MKKRANLVFCIIIGLIVAILIAEFKGYKNNKNYSAANYTTKEYKTKTTTFSANAVVNEKILVKEGQELDLTTYLNNNTEQLLWISNDDAIASVNANGIVKGIEVGKTTITAKNSSNEVVLSVDIIVGINNNFIDIKNTKLNTFVKNVQPKILFNGQYVTLQSNVMQGFAIKDNYLYITQDNKNGLIVSKMKYDLTNKSVINLVDGNGNKLDGNAEYMILNDTSHGDSFEVEVDKNLNSWIWLPTIKNSNGVPTAISRMKNISNNTDKWDATNKIAKYSYNFKSIDSNQQVNTWTVGNEYSSMSLDEKNGLISIRSGSTINHVYNIYKLDEWNEKGLNASEIITIKHSPLTHINSLFKKKFGETKYISIRNHAFSNRIIGSCRQGADIDGSYLYIYETLAVTKTSDMNNIQTTDEGYTYTVDDIIDILKSESEYLKDKSNVIKYKNTTTGVISEGYESDTYISIYDLSGKVVDGYYRYNVEKGLGDKISNVDFYKSYKNDGFVHYEREGIKVQDGIVYIGNTSVKADANNVYSNTKYQNILYFAEGILTGIKITTPPTKTSYVEGQDFDKTGMVISATYNNDSGEISKEIKEYTILDGEKLKEGQKYVTINYTENGTTKEIKQAISVRKRIDVTISNQSQNSSGHVLLAGEKAKINIEVLGNNIKIDPSKIIVKSGEQISMSGEPVVEDGKGGATIGEITKTANGLSLQIEIQTYEDNEKLGYLIIDLKEGFALENVEGGGINPATRETFYVASLNGTAKNNNNGKVDLTATVGSHNSFYIDNYFFKVIDDEIKTSEENRTTNEYTFRDLNSKSEYKVQVDITFYIDKKGSTYTKHGYITKKIQKSALTNELEMHFIDMSEGEETGDCIFVRIPAENNTYKTMLIDTGNYATGTNDDVYTAERLNNYILKNNYASINKDDSEKNIVDIDYLIITHPHGDHIGGFVKLTGTKYNEVENKYYIGETGIGEENIFYNFKNVIVGCNYEDLEQPERFKRILWYAQQNERNLIKLGAGNVLKIEDIIINIFNPYPVETIPIEWLGDYNKDTEKYFRDSKWQDLEENGGKRRS